MRRQRKLVPRGKVFPAAKTHTTNPWNLSGGGVGVVAVCGATLAAVCGVIVVAVYGVTVVRAACGATDSRRLRVERVYSPWMSASR